jgi:hypothetical protein
MIACVNLANLLLGSGLGLLLAWWGLDALTALAPSRIPGLGDVAINGWVLAFTLGAGVLTGVVTGMVPSLLASREGAALALRTGGQGLAGARGQQRLRGALVCMEVALSLILLVGAGLLVRSFGTLMGTERGFETENRLAASVSFPPGSSREEGIAFVHQLWPGEDPEGRIVTLWAGQDDTPGEVVGVVEDMRERGIDEGPTLAVYMPYLNNRFGPDLVVHTAGDPLAGLPALRAALAEFDPNLPLSGITTLEEMVGRSVGSQRFVMVLVSLFAGLALLLALAGVYGVLAYTVARQAPEIGVRMALGVTRGRILRKVILQAMVPAALGLVAGLGGALALSRLLATLLFEVEPGDPGTYAMVAATLLAAALVSAWLPARKAARVDPVLAFRAV